MQGQRHARAEEVAVMRPAGKEKRRGVDDKRRLGPRTRG